MNFDDIQEIVSAKTPLSLGHHAKPALLVSFYCCLLIVLNHISSRLQYTRSQPSMRRLFQREIRSLR